VPRFFANARPSLVSQIHNQFFKRCPGLNYTLREVAARSVRSNYGCECRRWRVH
jgi:hypothetical protein